jgi:hypothetical protein
MLAVTHHVITRVAALSQDKMSFDNYAVLGDDFVIRDDVVAESYLSIMNTLGVKVNLTKSVISKDFAEFAKRLKGPNIEITPMGAGLLLRFIRDRFYIGNIIREAHKLL